MYKYTIIIFIAFLTISCEDKCFGCKKYEIKINDSLKTVLTYEDDGWLSSIKEYNKGGSNFIKISHYDFYKTGLLCLAIVTLNDTSVQMTFYDSIGRVKSITHFRGDNAEIKMDWPRHGSSIEYFKNGKLRKVENYKNNNLTGKQMCYYPNGSLSSESYYDELGNYIKEFCWDSTGQKIQ